MDVLPLCNRCGQAPKLPGQRVCRRCLTTYQKDRRARQRQQTAAVSADVVLPPVTQTTVPAERPLVPGSRSPQATGAVGSVVAPPNVEGACYVDRYPPSLAPTAALHDVWGGCPCPPSAVVSVLY